MYSRNSFGSYYPIDSTLHKISPVIKVINLIITLILLVGCTYEYVHIFMLILTVLFMFLSQVPFKFYFKTFWSMRYIYLIIVFVSASLGRDLSATFVYLSKLIILVECLNIMIYTTSPSEICYGIEKTLKPFNIFYLPLNRIALSLTNTIRFIPMLITTENKILKSQASRGIDYNHSDIIGRTYAVLNAWKSTWILTNNKMNQIRFNSELRMFSPKRLRTNSRKKTIGFYDVMFLLFHILLVVVYAYERGLLWNI